MITTPSNSKKVKYLIITILINLVWVESLNAITREEVMQNPIKLKANSTNIVQSVNIEDVKSNITTMVTNAMVLKKQKDELHQQIKAKSKDFANISKNGNRADRDVWGVEMAKIRDDYNTISDNYRKEMFKINDLAKKNNLEVFEIRLIESMGGYEK